MRQAEQVSPKPFQAFLQNLQVLLDDVLCTIGDNDDDEGDGDNEALANDDEGDTDHEALDTSGGNGVTDARAASTDIWMVDCVVDISMGSWGTGRITG